MEALSLSELFTLIAAGASVAIAAVAIGLSLVYFILANRLFRKTEETVDEIEKSVNQMYGALTKLSKRSEFAATEIEDRVTQLKEIAEQIGEDAQLLNKAALQQKEPRPFQPFLNPQPSLERAPSNQVLNISPSKNGDDSLQARISAIVDSEQEDDETAW